MEERSSETSLTEMDALIGGVIDDDDDDSRSSSSKQIIDLKGSKTEVEKEKGKEKEKKVFWDKESNERAAKEINEEDSYRWEDEVRN